MSITVTYLPGLAMRRISNSYQRNAKTDQHDALIIAQAARTMPHITIFSRLG
ncbi:IS110 family transposase [Gleimia hominis]|uniref:IS110 family transposase n=1 Tax=Gleimia hominis TaxID=595468 RepID=UPI0013040600